MTLYHDPLIGDSRPTLVGDLLGIPARDKNHQLENQATTVLAWLVDRSPTIGRSVLRLFLGDHAAVDAGLAIGAQTQVSLVKPDGGALYPDLSICVAERKLQLLVEVKVDSVHALYEEYGGQLQPQVYRDLWADAGPGDAAIRALGTLTRNASDTEPDPEHKIARDVSWRCLGEELGTLLTNGHVEEECRLVAESFVAAINERISPAPPSADKQHEFFELHAPLLDGVKDEIARLIRGTGGAKAIRGNAYFGWRIPLPSATDAPLFLRMYLSPRDTRLNLPGKPDSLIVAPERGPNGELESNEREQVKAAGFPRTKDIARFPLHRRLWSLDGLDATATAAEIVALLAKTGLLLEGAIEQP